MDLTPNLLPSSQTAAAPVDVRLRQRLMRALAHVEPDGIAQALTGLGPLPPADDLRKPETGLVMLRGRIGGDGSVFNIGEATVSRAVVRIASGEIGFGWRLGRSLDAARHSALADALLQHPDWRQHILEKVVLPLETQHVERRTESAKETAATKVEFFTMARGSQ